MAGLSRLVWVTEVNAAPVSPAIGPLLTRVTAPPASLTTPVTSPAIVPLLVRAIVPSVPWPRPMVATSIAPLLSTTTDARPALNWTPASIDRQSVVEGTSVYVRVDLGGRQSIKKKKQRHNKK